MKNDSNINHMRKEMINKPITNTKVINKIISNKCIMAVMLVIAAAFVLLVCKGYGSYKHNRYNVGSENVEITKDGRTHNHKKKGKQKDKDYGQSKKNDNGDGEQQDEQQNNMSSIELAKLGMENRHIIEDTNYDEYSNKLYAWWFKRNDNHEKSGCQEDFDITGYDAHYTVPVNDKRIYITFDCGYENGFTPDMLDILKEEGVTAAFFVTQTFIRDNIDIVRRMKEEGHLVCNHTVTHPSMPSKSIDDQKNELLTCEQYMKEATGYDMDLFFRPPKGEYSERTLQMAKDLGYTTIFWSMAYLDYDVNNQPSASHVIEHFSKYHHPGAIPLIHNVSKANHDALKSVLELLKNEGYSFGSLYELKADNTK